MPKNPVVMTQEKIVDLFRTEKDEYGNPIENLTIKFVSDYFGTKYRSTADILARMVENGTLESDADSDRTKFFSLRVRKALTEEDIQELFAKMVDVCKTNINDRACEMILNTIVERDGGLMPDFTVKKDKDGNPKVHTRGKLKGQIMKKKNGGFGYLVKSIFTVMHDYNLL